MVMIRIGKNAQTNNPFLLDRQCLKAEQLQDEQLHKLNNDYKQSKLMGESIIYGTKVRM